MAPPLFSSRWLLHLLLVSILLVSNPTATNAQFPYQFCPAGDANYTANSTFQSNLNRLLSSLPATASAAGFANDTAGDVPDRVYGLVLCRGDVARDACRSCLATGAEDILQGCPYKRSAVIWYDYCMLRYSNLRFFSVDGGPGLYMWNSGNLTEVTLFNWQRDRMMAALVRYAAYNASARMFATGEADYDDAASQKIYGLVQCTRDLTADGCSACLTGILGDLRIRFPRRRSRGARIIKATCNFRYELYSFYNGTAMVSIALPTNATPPTAPVQPPMPTPAAQGKEKKNRMGTVLAIAIPLGVALVVFSLTSLYFCGKKSKKIKFYVRDTQEITTVESLSFDLSTLRDATCNFSDLNKLGQGGFGSVYKGLLSNGQEIAVKRLSAGSGQGVEELKNEVVLLAKLQHRNLVRLLGVCLQGEEKLLVYEYVPNRSLDKFLFDHTRAPQLNWERRYKIIGGIARGLQYLHEESQVKIIHRDLKASNILLDADMKPKISDFGLARLFGGDQSQASTTRVVGTLGYMAPEYAMRGLFSNKSDVFSFGVLVLEIVTGQRNTDFSGSGNSIDLLSYVWEQWRNGTVVEKQMIDPSLGGHYQWNEVMRCVQIGLQCVQEDPAARPAMNSVVLMLSSDSVSLQVPSRPAFCVGYSQPYSDVMKNTQDSSTSTTRGDSTSKTVPYSLNEVTITEVDPR